MITSVRLPLLVALLAAVGFVVVAAPATASTPAVSVSALCAPATPGHATCFAEQVTGGVSPMTTTPAGFGPADLQSAYALPASPAGAGQTVYIVDAYDDPTAESDLATYRSAYGLTPCTTANGCFAKLNQTGAASPLPAYNAGWAGEISLDLDMVSATCPACSIRLIEANDNGSNLYAAVKQSVNMGARFVSMSWGGGEWSSESSIDSSYFNATGVLFAASTGDNGFAGGPSYPAMSPNVLAVGGTTLSRAGNSRGWAETAWSGAGSGCSAFESKPAWQTFIDSGTCSRRAGADVSAVADPSTGVAVVNGGRWGVYGGTSASAPIVASVYALAGTPAAGSAPQSFPYQHSTAFTDVTGGSNGTCAATRICGAAVGWDGPTGLGTPTGVAGFTGSGTTSTPPPPTALGAALSLDSSVVPGEAAKASVTPQLPAGRTLTSIAWSTSRTDCALSSLKSADTLVACSPTATGSATVTAKLTDSTGATKSVSGSVALTSGIAKRATALSLSFDGQTGSTAGVCTSAASPVVATVTDATNGEPIKGLSVILTKKASGATAFTSAGSAVTAFGGAATSQQAVSVTTVYSVTATAAGVFTAPTPATVSVTTAACSPTIAATTSASRVWYGATVTVTGTATRSSSAGTLPIAGLHVPVTVTTPSTLSSSGSVVAGRTVQLASVSTDASGSFTATFKATVAGQLAIIVPKSTSYTAASADLGPLTVDVPTTAITAAAHVSEVGYNTPFTVTGTLTATADSAYPLTGQTVNLMLTPSGSSIAKSIATAKVGADGTFSATAPGTATGTLRVAFNGVAGLPAASGSAGTITVDSWTPALTLAAGSSHVGYGTSVTYSGSVTRTTPLDGTRVATGLAVKLMLAPTAGGAAQQLGSATTTTSGTFTFKVAAKASGTVTAVVSSVPGYLNGQSSGVAITVDNWTLAVKSSTSAAAIATGSYVVVSGSATRTCSVQPVEGASGQPVQIYLTPAGGGTPVLIGSTSTTGTGAYTVRAYPRTSGTITARMAGSAGYTAAVSTGSSVLVS